MKIVILHNAVLDTDSLADRDVLVQVAAVERALAALGHTTRRLPCTLNLETIEESLTRDRPELVFNLVESLAGYDRLAHLAAMLLADLDLPCTGTPATALQLTNNKPRAKARLRAAGLPTPDWVLAEQQIALPPPYIIKAIWEHASLGIDDHAVVYEGDGTTVSDQIASRSRQLGESCFAEQYIDGREFNLSLIATPDGPRVLPPAEIDFAEFPAGKPRIVGYSAKWDDAAFEYRATPRKFDFDAADAPLLDWLRSLAVECWRLFDLGGYARVDFRVDEAGQPWILEVNANPCLSPDAGFAAALARAHLPFERAMEWILEDALRPKRAADSEGVPVETVSPRPARRQAAVAAGRQAAVVAAAATAVALEEPTRPLAERAPGSAAASAPPARRTRRPTGIKLRSEVKPEDRDAVRQLVTATGLFREGEIDVAVELVEARLTRGEASGYEFVFAEQKGQLAGYICYGKNTLTISSYDVYWIVVDPARQGRGIGRLLLEEAERHIQAAGGTRIYIETSHRPDYAPTRGFYERCGYVQEALLVDFYAPGDGKAIYTKILTSA